MLKDEYDLAWSEEDQEFVATFARYPSLSFLAPTTEAALAGLHKLVIEIDDDIRAGQRVEDEELSTATKGIKEQYGDALRRLSE